MTYVLRRTTTEDQTMIKQNTIRFNKRRQFFSPIYDLPLAIDEEMGFYLYKTPSVPMPDDYDRYHFLFKNYLYELCSHRYSRDKCLRLLDPIDLTLFPEFQREIKTTFSIFNRWGRPLIGDDDKDWQDVINSDLDLETINQGDDLRL